MRSDGLTPEEKDREVQKILIRGLKKPKTMRRFLAEILGEVGVRNVFLQAPQTLLISVLTLAGLLPLMLMLPEGGLFRGTLMLAPSLFLAILSFLEVMERAGGLYELASTFKYTAGQMAALRILCFSLPGAVFCAAVSAIAAQNVSQLLRLVSLSLSSLFLCAFLSLFLGRFTARVPFFARACVSWAALMLIPAIAMNTEWEAFLSNLPLAFAAGAAAVSAMLFVMETRKLLFKKEDFSYAFDRTRN